jgi:hypothetical protein
MGRSQGTLARCEYRPLGAAILTSSGVAAASISAAVAAGKHHHPIRQYSDQSNRSRTSSSAKTKSFSRPATSLETPPQSWLPPAARVRSCRRFVPPIRAPRTSGRHLSTVDHEPALRSAQGPAAGDREEGQGADGHERHREQTPAAGGVDGGLICQMWAMASNQTPTSPTGCSRSGKQSPATPGWSR